MSEWSSVDGSSAEEIEIAVARMRPPRRMLVSFVAVVLSAGVVAAAAGLASGGGRTAHERLAAAQAHVSGVESYRFEALMTDVMGSPTDAAPGSTSTMRTRTTVAVASPDRWHVVSDSGDWADESIHIGDALWERYADAADQLGDAQWVEVPADAYDVPEGDAEDWDEMLAEVEGMGAAAGFGASFFGHDPVATVELVAGAVDPVLVSESPDGATLRVTPPATPELDGLDLTIEVELDLDSADVPRALRISSSADDSSSEIAITFTAWGGELEVVAPAEDEIDRTPWLDEDSLLAYRASAVYLPAVLPDGFELVGIDVWAVDEEWGECAQIVLDVGQLPAELPADLAELDALMEQSMDTYLSVTSLATDCAEDSSIGVFRGGQGRELTFGETRVFVESSLPADAFEAVVATLAPVDPAALVDPFNARQVELGPLGLYFGL